MFVTHTPEDGDKQEWEFRPGQVRHGEMVMVENRAGTPWPNWLQNIKMGSGPARIVLIWHLLRREHPGVRWEDVERSVVDDDITVELSVDELERNRQEWRTAGGESAEGAHLVLAEFERQIADSRAKHGDGESGKAR